MKSTMLPSENAARKLITVMTLVVSGVVIASIDAAAGPAAQTKTASYNITHQCTGHTTDGWCAPVRSFDAKTAGLLTLKYTASTKHCTPVKVGMVADDGKNKPHVKEFAAPVPPGGTAEVTFYVPRAAYKIELYVGESAGGCEGYLQSWGGTMKITTTDDGTLGDLDPPKTTPKPPSGSTSGSASNSGGGSAGGGSTGGGGTNSSGNASVGGTTLTPGPDQSPDPNTSATPGLPPQTSSTAEAQAIDDRAASDRSSFPWWVIVALALALIAGGGGYMFWRRQHGHG